MTAIAEVHALLAQAGGGDLTEEQAVGIARAYARSRYGEPTSGSLQQDYIVVMVVDLAVTILLSTPTGRDQSAALAHLDSVLHHSLAAITARNLPEISPNLYRYRVR